MAHAAPPSACPRKFAPDLLAHEAFRSPVMKDLDRILVAGIKGALGECVVGPSSTTS